MMPIYLARRRSLLTVLLGATLLGACGGGSSNGPEPEPRAAAGQDAYSMIAGLYDYSYEIQGNRDEIYLELTGDGQMRVFDYLGDAVDRGENCYAASTSLQLVHIGGDQFRGEDDDQPATIRRSPGQLTITYVDEDDEDDDGDTSELITYELPEVTGLSTADFTACDDTAYLQNDPAASGRLRELLSSRI